jgi:hypothetical protein
MRMLVEAMQHGLRTRLAEVEARMLQEHRNQPPRFEESTSWVAFPCQFEAMVGHNNWMPCEKSMHLLAILQGQAASVLHCVPIEATYREISGAMKVAIGAIPWPQTTAFT